MDVTHLNPVARSYGVIGRHLLLSCICISLLSLGACRSGADKNGMTNGTVKAVDTTGDVKTILAKTDNLVMGNKLDDAVTYLTPNLRRFRGAEKAKLVNALAGVYFLKDDANTAVANYLAACDLDPGNTEYMLNVAGTYENIGSKANALIFANKVLALDNATDSDKIAAREVIAKCDKTSEGP